MCIPFSLPPRGRGTATRWKEFYATRSFRHFLAKMTPSSERKANISPVTAGTKAPHNQNTLTFEPNPPPFTAMTLTGQIIPALNFSREFLRECVPQIAFFRTFFSKKKVHKGKAFAESPFRRRLQTLTHLQIPPVNSALSIYNPANPTPFGDAPCGNK